MQLLQFFFFSGNTVAFTEGRGSCTEIVTRSPETANGCDSPLLPRNLPLFLDVRPSVSRAVMSRNDSRDEAQRVKEVCAQTAHNALSYIIYAKI